MSTAKYIYQGVDYLRLVGLDHSPYAGWEDACEHEFMAEDRAGRRPHFRWVLNYYGRVGEHCFLGKNEEGCMVQASSHLADTLFRPLSNAGGRCSRIDLQITCKPPEGPDKYLHIAYDSLKAHEALRGRPQLLEMRDSNNGAKMVTIGSRQSEVYARIYDKGKESGDPEWDGHVRFEIESKGQTARDLHAWLREDMTRVHTVKAVVENYFEKRGVPVFWDEWELREMPAQVKRTRTDDTKIAWLATQVAPTMRALIERGKGMEAMRALLHGAVDDAIIEQVIDALSQSVHR